MPKPEVHTVILSLSEAEHAESDPESVMTFKNFVVYTVYCAYLPMSICVLKAECVFGLRADPRLAASSSDLCRLHLWEWSIHTHAAHPTDKHSYCLAANIFCANICNKSEDKHQLQTVQTWKGQRSSTTTNSNTFPLCWFCLIRARQHPSENFSWCLQTPLRDS